MLRILCAYKINQILNISCTLDHKEVEHAEDKDDDHVLQHRLELAALPD